jgi:hypothetical protein
MTYTQLLYKLKREFPDTVDFFMYLLPQPRPATRRVIQLHDNQISNRDILKAQARAKSFM